MILKLTKFVMIFSRIIQYNLSQNFYWRNFMDWNGIQNFLSNIVFAILLVTMILYWINLSFFNKTSLCD